MAEHDEEPQDSTIVAHAANGDGLRVGDWVLVRMRVAEQGTKQPENIRLTARSKTDEWDLLLLAEHVVERVEPPGGWPRCNHLVTVDDGALVRCEAPYGHSSDHESMQISWKTEETTGYIEEA